MKHLGETARSIRLQMRLTQAEMSERLGISIVQLSKIENDHSMPSAQLIVRYEEVSGINPYVADWCRNPNASNLPSEVRDAALELHRLWSNPTEQ